MPSNSAMSQYPTALDFICARPPSCRGVSPISLRLGHNRPILKGRELSFAPGVEIGRTGPDPVRSTFGCKEAFSSMRPVKRLLVFTIEAGVFLLGVVLSFALVIVSAMVSRLDPAENDFGGVIGILLAIVGFIAVRGKTRKWKIEYDAVGWTLAQAEGKLHPTLARRKRIARRILVWAPSLIAAA